MAAAVAVVAVAAMAVAAMAVQVVRLIVDLYRERSNSEM